MLLSTWKRIVQEIMRELRNEFVLALRSDLWLDVESAGGLQEGFGPTVQQENNVNILLCLCDSRVKESLRVWNRINRT
jgi:hypothetical protein